MYKSKNLLLCLLIGSIVLSSAFIKSEAIDYKSLFNEAFAIIGDDAESAKDKANATPVLLAAYAAMDDAEAKGAAKKISKLDANLQKQLSIVNPVNRASEVADRVKTVKEVYAAVLAK